MPDLFGDERRSIERKREADDSFALFWEKYPRKVNRLAAVKAWNKLRPSPELVARILEALEWQVDQWDDPLYTPHASSYLNGERWNDEPPAAAAPKTMSKASAAVLRLMK
jgi:anti-sigma-K factor RskA